jgi:hypothetical protein
MAPSFLTAVLQTVRDTVYMAPARDGLATAALVANLVLTIAFVLIVLGLVALLFQLRGIQKSVTALLGRLERKADPMLDRGRDVVANVEFITAAVRTDVQRVSDSVKSLSERLHQASDRMERRIDDFNALMEVVQGEAEDIFLGSAAAVRGVRAGARALRGGSADDEIFDEDDVALEDEAGLAPRALEPAALETQLAPEAAPGGVQVTGPAAVAGGAPRRAGT